VTVRGVTVRDVTVRREQGPSTAFGRALAERTSGARARRIWVYATYDQLTSEAGPLAAHDPRETGLLLVESPWKAGRRPYHRQKLALVLANGRQFALEQAARGVRVVHRVARGPYRDALAEVARALREDGSLRAGAPFLVMEPAEREMRADLAPRIADGTLRVVPHEGWLTTADDFARSQRRPPYRMDRFYEQVRRRTGVLMEPDGTPVGGRFSFDAENRRAWPGAPPAPALPTFDHDAVTEEVLDLVATRFASYPGRLDPEHLPATAAHAEALWAWALRACLPLFGPYEDAMSRRERTLFHTRLSMLLNLHRLLPRRVLADALAAPGLPLPSREGFVRQILGWREFVRHVHLATDGFRRDPRVAGGRAHAAIAVAPAPGGAPAFEGDDGGALPNALGQARPLPPVFWGGAPSGLACLDDVVEGVWEEGYSHHITRLMVLGNLATLLDVDPRALTDWFWVAYADAYDWVVEPNVLGMATWATGGLMTTKPYVAGSAYLRRMGDHCDGCAFDPGKDCPITPLYWAFLDRHAPALRNNPRLRVVMAASDKRDARKKAADAATFARVSGALGRGERLR
jgi:deoxyribodipyrimidine photolyase-related protein